MKKKKVAMRERGMSKQEKREKNTKSKKRKRKRQGQSGNTRVMRYETTGGSQEPNQTGRTPRGVSDSVCIAKSFEISTSASTSFQCYESRQKKVFSFCVEKVDVFSDASPMARFIPSSSVSVAVRSAFSSSAT